MFCIRYQQQDPLIKLILSQNLVFNAPFIQKPTNVRVLNRLKFQSNFLPKRWKILIKTGLDNIQIVSHSIATGRNLHYVIKNLTWLRFPSKCVTHATAQFHVRDVFQQKPTRSYLLRCVKALQLRDKTITYCKTVNSKNQTQKTASCCLKKTVTQHGFSLYVITS